MRITGYKDYRTGYYYIHATFTVTTKPFINQDIRFMVDTGAQSTTISVGDTISFYELIPPPTSSTRTPGGGIPTSVISNCYLAFDLKQSLHIEKLLTINILHPPLNSKMFNDMLLLPSVLGMDILGRYYLHFDNTAVILEK